MLIMEAPLLETLILFLILAVEEIIVVKAVGQARLLKMKTKSDKKSTLMVAWKGKKNSIFQKRIRVFYVKTDAKKMRKYENWPISVC